ncbi:MAG: type II toxin-antitoxin system VapB family antitoxin [Verrucomicrobiota bacterium]|nr:type II toxin-antitoxin system VapB family antitoxin [Verrucomicrobiota bacterium]
MPTNLAIDDQLLQEALEVGHHKTKKDTVNEALKEYIQRRQQRQVLKLFGSLVAEDPIDPKAFRRR